MSKPRTQKQRREAAIHVVLDSACYLFGEYGYQATSLEDIAKRSGMTIRPIYHYFGNKEKLFLAVTERMENQLHSAMHVKDAEKDGQNLLQYWKAFLELGRDRRFRQIVLVDSPVVLGRERWTESLIVQRVMDILIPLFPALMPQTRHLVAQMVIAALTEVALYLGEPGNLTKEQAFDEISGLIQNGLASMAIPGTSNH